MNGPSPGQEPCSRGTTLYRDLGRKGEAAARATIRPGSTASPATSKSVETIGFRGASTGRLAAARGVDLLLERAEADRADHDLAGRAVEPERLGELEALLDLRLDLVAPHVLLDARDVEADFLGDRERARLVRLAAAAEQLEVELEVFLAGLVLHARGRRDLRRLHRSLAEHGKFLEHEFELAVVLEQVEHVGHGALAVAAIVVEEFHQRDVALRIAERHLARRGKNGGAVILDGGAVLVGLRQRLALLELAHHLLQELGMAQQIFLDDALDLAALLAGEGLRGGGSRRRQDQRDREQGGCERAGTELHGGCPSVVNCGERSAAACSWRCRRL